MLRICKNFEIIYSSSERSVQFLVPECFFRTDNLEQLEFKFVGKLGFRNMQEKLENGFALRTEVRGDFNIDGTKYF